MLCSMTGFASKITTFSLDDASKVSMTLSIKSLNSRFFETTCKLPQQFTSLETDIIKLLKQTLYRGHIYCTIQVNNNNLFKGGVEPSFSMIQSYKDAIENIQKKCNITGSLSVDSMLLLPNIFSVEEKELDATTRALVVTTVEELAQQVVQERFAEGKTLYEDIQLRSRSIKESLKRIEAQSSIAIEAQKEKMKLALLAIETDDENNALAGLQKNSAYAFLEKIDINEEIVRFKSHLENMDKQLDAPAVEKGKRLDFTLQELGREINTIAAKCSDAIIGAATIDVKVELEKIREQIQNCV